MGVRILAFAIYLQALYPEWTPDPFAGMAPHVPVFKEEQLFPTQVPGFPGG